MPPSEVLLWLKARTPVRFWSLGTRRLLALRISAPNLMEWLPNILVQFVTPWNSLSFSTSGQLQRPTPKPSPQLVSVPSPSNSGSPDVNSACSAPALVMFSPGAPASLIGVAPWNDLWVCGLYLNHPKRKSAIQLGPKVLVAPMARL